MEKLIEIEGKKLGMKCSAGTVRTYRDLFGRDLILDMATIEKELIETKQLTSDTCELAEQIIWLMAREYDHDLPELPEFLDQFSPYFSYNATGQVIYMWRECVKTLNSTKKNSEKLSENGRRRFSFFGQRSSD
jgi:hypothetical protein